MSHLHVSDDASMAAYVDRKSGIMAVHDIRRRALAGAVRVPLLAQEWTTFSAGHVRVVTAAENPKTDNLMCSYDYDLDRHTLTQTAQITVPPGMITMQTSAKGSIVVVRNETVAESHGVLIDAANGHRLAELGPRPAARVRLLEDGRIAYSYAAGPTEHLRVIDFAGTTLADIDLGISGLTAVRDEIAPGKLIVSHRNHDERTSKLLVADVNSARVLRTEQGLIARTFPGWGGGGWDPQARVVSRPQLVMDPKGSLLQWNPLTGEKKVVVGG